MNFSLFRFGGAQTFSAQCTLIFPSVGSALLPASLPDWQVSFLAHKKRDKTMQRRMLQLKFMRQKLGQMTVTRSEGAGSSRLGGVNSDFHDCLGVSFAANTRIPPLDFIGCQTNPHSTHLPLPTFPRDTRTEGNLTSVHFAGKATQWTCLQAFVLLISISSLLLRTVSVSHPASLAPTKSC